MRVTHLLLYATLCLAWSNAFSAIEFTELSEDGQELVIHLKRGQVVLAPRTGASQNRFSAVKVSSNGRYVGWLAQYPNCCTSYSLPQSLVVHNGLQIVRIISANGPPIFEWKFGDSSKSIAYKQEYPHGGSPRYFFEVRISDGKVLPKLASSAIATFLEPTTLK
jgi:hypothetical protein